jgi:hypothetical protein
METKSQNNADDCRSKPSGAGFRQQRAAWDERLRHWMQVAYDDNLK